MRNKILTVILMILMIFTIGSISSFAEDNNIELNLKGTTSINKDTKTVELTLSLGKFTGIDEELPMGYQGTLEYDTNMFKSVTVEGLSGWSGEYNDSDKTILGDVAKAYSNTDIAKITLTLNDNVKEGTKGTVKLSNVVLSDGNNNFSYNKEITITVEGNNSENPGTSDTNQEPSTNTNTEVPEQPNTNQDTNKNTNSGTTNTKSNIVANNSVNTLGMPTKLPYTGLKSLIIFVIVIAIILTIIFKIKSKDIKY